LINFNNQQRGIGKSKTVQTFWFALGSLSSVMLTLVSAAILSRYLDKGEYGSYKQIIYIYNSLLVVFSAGLPKVFSYFLPKYSVQEGVEIVKKISVLLLYCGVFFGSVLFLGAEVFANALNNMRLVDGIRWFAIVPVFLLPTLGIEGIFAAYERTLYLAVYNTITRLILLLFITSPVIIFGHNYIYAIYGWILSSVFIFLLALYFKRIPFKGIIPKKSKLKVREIFDFSFPLVTASLAGLVFNSSNQFYISRYFGPEVFAEFSNGFIQLPLVGIIVGSASSILMPYFSKLDPLRGDKFELISTWQSTIKKSALLIYPLVVFFFLFAKETVLLIFGTNYEASSIYFKLILVYNFFNILIFTPLILSMGKVRFYSMIHVILAIMIWIGSWVLLNTHNSAVLIIIYFVGLEILKVLVFVYYSSKILNIKFVDIFPVGMLIKLFIHSFLCIGSIRFFLFPYVNEVGILPAYILSLLSSFVLILMSSKYFKLNYKAIVNPLLSYFKVQI